MNCHNCGKLLEPHIITNHEHLKDYNCPDGHAWLRTKNETIEDYEFFIEQNNKLYKISSLRFKTLNGKLYYLTSLAKFINEEYRIILQIPLISIREYNHPIVDKLLNKLKTYLTFS